MATAEKSATETSPPAATEAPAARRYRFDVEQYYKMAEAGILTRGHRVELIDGDILVMSPIGSRHHGCVIDLQYLLWAQIGARGVVSVQGPVRLDARSEPEPDVAVLKPRADSYRSAHAGPSDVLLIVEVGNTSAASDRTEKLGLYARSGVPEVWLVDLNREVIEVYRRPAGGAYAETRALARGESLAPEAFPDVVIGVTAVLGRVEG